MSDNDYRLQAMSSILQRERSGVLGTAKGSADQERNMLDLWVKACVSEAVASWKAANPKGCPKQIGQMISEAASVG